MAKNYFYLKIGNASTLAEDLKYGHVFLVAEGCKAFLDEREVVYENGQRKKFKMLWKGSPKPGQTIIDLQQQLQRRSPGQDKVGKGS